MARDHVCEFCDKGFSSEKTLKVHMCEAKRRMEMRNEPAVALGYMGFQKFYSLNGVKKEKTYEEFAKSPYFKAFHRWAMYCRNTKVVDPMIYLDWLLKEQVKIDRWNTDRVYDSYLKNFMYAESVDQALTRTWETFNDWADVNNSIPKHYILYASHSRVINDITRGRVSPWVLYVSNRGQEFIASLAPEQLELIIDYINPDKWIKKVDRSAVDLETVRQWVKDKGIDE